MEPPEKPFESFSLNTVEVFYQAIEELAKPYPSMSLPEWGSFNEAVGGLRLREFSILCGSTGSGKTTFLANLSSKLLQSNIKHFVMSVETGHTDFMKRIISALKGEDLNLGIAVPAAKLLKISEEYADLIKDELVEFALYDNRVSLEILMMELDYMVNVKKCKVAMIDNLNFFMSVTRASDQVIEMDRVVHEVIMFCKKNDVHIFMVMHPKKSEGAKDTRVYSEYEIKGSSTAVQEAHNVFLWNKPTLEEVNNGNRHITDRELTIRKLRRRGVYVGKTILFENKGTKYIEKGFV